MFLPALAAAILVTTPAPPLEAALFDELTELYPDSNAIDGAASLELHTPRSVPVGVHLLVTNLDPGADLAFTLERDGQPVPDARWFRLHDVPVEENTGLASRTEQFDGRTNPHVVRRAPFQIFEALEPVASPIAAPGAGTVALRVEIPIARDVTPGPCAYRVLVKSGEKLIDLDLDVTVHAAVVPPPGRDTVHYTNWFSPANVAKFHDLEPWSEAFWAMLGNYADLMARGRQNTFWVRWPDVFEVVPGEAAPRLNRERLERYVRTFEAAGLYWIEGAPIARRPGGDWSSPVLELSLAGAPATGPEGRAALADMAAQLGAVLDENGWRERWLQHVADEPTDVNAEDYRALAAHLRSVLPGVPIVEATMSREVAGAIDVWCPQVQKYQQHRDFFDGRRAAGERIWVYTCLVPGGPWLNRMLDMERLRQVYVGWALARYDLDGFLHWGLNHYKADPFAHSVVDHPATPGTNNKLPAGDSHVVYPGPDGPWSSHRFEAHRIGLEDHALLLLLREHDPAAADAIVARVFRAFDDHETDVAAYRAAKRALLVELDEVAGEAQP